MSAQQIKSRWLDKTYPASFTGGSTFINALRKDKKIKQTSSKKILNILQTIPSYAMHLRRRRHLETRHLNFIPKDVDTSFTDGVGISFMADLAVMPPSNGFNYYLCLVDLFDNYVYCEPLKTKTAPEENDLTKFSDLGTDAGGEFTVYLLQCI
jgi:hypothetical protein